MWLVEFVTLQILFHSTMKLTEGQLFVKFDVKVRNALSVGWLDDRISYVLGVSGVMVSFLSGSLFLQKDGHLQRQAFLKMQRIANHKQIQDPGGKFQPFAPLFDFVLYWWPWHRKERPEANVGINGR